MWLKRNICPVALTLAACLWVAVPLAAPRAASRGEMPGPTAAPLMLPYDCRINFYVDASGGNDANPGTKAAPWKTIQNADNGYPNVPRAGECINILPGTYTLGSTLILSHGGNLNARDGYVVYRSVVPQAAHLVAQAGLAEKGNGDMIMLWGSYIVIDGFDIDGNHAVTAGSGVDGCANGGGPGNIAHHFYALNNEIHDMGGSGLSSCTADYIVWQHNVVFNTASTNHYQMSGINIWQPKALAPGSFTPTDADTVPFGIRIEYNIAHDNGEGPAIAGPHSDGNGIIIDTTLGSVTCPTCGTPYPGNILIRRNVSYGNGGGGIHVFLSKNVTISENTVYNNYLDVLNPGTARGELSNGGSENIDWIDNIAIAVPGRGILASNRPTVSFPVQGGFGDSGRWRGNIAFGGPPAPDSASYLDPAANFVGVDPRLENPAAGKFAPGAGSPAIRAGAPDIGAY